MFERTREAIKGPLMDGFLSRSCSHCGDFTREIELDQGYCWACRTHVTEHDRWIEGKANQAVLSGGIIGWALFAGLIFWGRFSGVGLDSSALESFLIAFGMGLLFGAPLGLFGGLIRASLIFRRFHLDRHLVRPC